MNRVVAKAMTERELQSRFRVTRQMLHRLACYAGKRKFECFGNLPEMATVCRIRKLGLIGRFCRGARIERRIWPLSARASGPEFWENV